MYTPWRDSDPRFGGDGFTFDEVLREPSAEFYRQHYPELVVDARLRLAEAILRHAEPQERTLIYFGKGIRVDRDGNVLLPDNEDHFRNMLFGVFEDGTGGMTKFTAVENEIQKVGDSDLAILSRKMVIKADGTVMYDVGGLNMATRSERSTPQVNPLEKHPYITDDYTDPQAMYTTTVYVLLEQEESIGMHTCEQVGLVEGDDMETEVPFLDLVEAEILLDPKIEGLLFAGELADRYGDEMPRFVNNRWVDGGYGGLADT